MAKHVGESSLRYVGPYDGPQTCCKIVGRDRYGNKQPCGKRATAQYQSKGGGSVYLCEGCRPSVSSMIGKLFDGFESVMEQVFGRK